jgi:hypothetical protein
MSIDEVAEYIHEDDLEEATDNMLETIVQRHPDMCDNVTSVVLSWEDKSAPGKSMQHEQIRDLTDNELWRAARDAEKGIRNNTRSGKRFPRKGKAQNNGMPSTEDLDSVINEVESFVKQWEEGK